MYYVYILQSLKTKELYKGFTINLDRRLKQHESGRVLLRLIHVEICPNRRMARELEKYFKSGYGREILKEITE